MADRLPPLNPFPAQATTAIEEGPFVESYRSWAEGTPTMPLEPVRRLNRLTVSFRDSAIGDERQGGQVAFVHGAHGAGKTHAIRAAIGRAATESPDAPLLPLYVKLSSLDFLPAYRQLMAQLSISDLTDLALRFLGSLSPAAPLAHPDGPAAGELRRDPKALLRMFDEHLLERGRLLEAQADQLRDVVRDETNFQRALTYLLEPDLKSAAYDWLLGRQVAEAKLRQLGISGQLATPDQCRYGLQLLTLVCAGARRPLVLILDQAEKFLLDPAGLLVPESAGLLHSLVEAIPDQRGMLVVAANDEAWTLLPEDLRQRFGPNDVPCPVLQPEQVIELVGLYVAAAFGPDLPAGYRAPWPYTDRAVRRLLRNSGGNLRSLLQLGWRSFDSVAPDADAIDSDRIPEHVEVFDLASVLLSVRRVLRQFGPVTEEPQLGFQYAVDLPGRGRLLVRVSEAMFYTDEAARAEEDVQARLSLDATYGRSPRPGPVDEQHVLIVVGYASLPVLRLLREVYEVLVYRDSESLAKALRQLAGWPADTPADAGVFRPAPNAWVTPPPPMPGTPQPVAAQGAETAVDFPRIYGRLADLNLSRRQANVSLQAAFLTLDQRRVADDTRRRTEELTTRWPAERRRLTDRITEARRQRQLDELSEMHRLAAAHQNTTWFGRALTFILVWFTAVLLLYLTDRVSPVLVNVISGFAAAAGAVAVTFGGRAGSGRSSPPTSLTEVERIARDRTRRRWPLGILGGPTRVSPQTLRSGDPYRRYGYALSPAHGQDRRPVRAALTWERAALVRRALADRLGRMPGTESGRLVPTEADLDLPELPYQMQHQRDWRWREIVGLKARYRLFAALVDVYGGGAPTTLPPAHEGDLAGPAVLGMPPDGTGRSSTAEYDPAVLQVVRVARGDGPLGAAYRSGWVDQPRLMIEAVREADERELRRAARMLSPLASDGLGSCDHLWLTEEIERLYLFFEQLLFYWDGGVGLTSEVGPDGGWTEVEQSDPR